MSRLLQIINLRILFLSVCGVVFFFNTKPIYAQNKVVTGIVKTTDGGPLPGADIMLKGATRTGTITNAKGEFSLNVPSYNVTLVFSFIGYETKVVDLNGRSKLTVVLNESTTTGTQLVVIGYGSTKKTDLTGSVSTVKTQRLKNIPANSIEHLLQGRVAGLQIINSSQEPGAGSTVRIRGASSINGSNSPLIVVDGFPLGDAGNLKQINPENIKSIEVLKDASASAIYGSRGANGVILITTKDGTSGKTQITVNQQVTISQFTSKLDLWRNPVLMAQLSNESQINAGLQPLYIGQTNGTGVYYPSVEQLASGAWPYYTQWDKLVFRKSPVSNNTTFDISSSNKKTRFYLSGNYYTDQGQYIQDNYKKIGYNLSVQQQIFDNLKVSFKNILSKGFRHPNNGLAYWRNPIFPVRDSTGNYYQIGVQDYSNPIAITNLQKIDTKSIDVLSMANIAWNIIPSLKLTSQLNYKYGSYVTDSYYPPVYTQTGAFNNGAGYIANWLGRTLISETYLNFDKEFGRHHIKALLGYSYERDMSRGSNLGAFDFVNSTLGNQNMSSGNPQLNTVSNSYSLSRLVSGYFRLNYSYENKYLFTFTTRDDGSSKFGENNKWAIFPSGAISWKADQENFIKRLNVFNQLKFRFSYGLSGNQGISPYQTLSRYGVEKYFMGGQFVTGIGPGYIVGRTGPNGIFFLWGGIPNPDLKWETTAQSDFGIDTGVFDNRIHLTFDYYSKLTSHLLRQRILSPSSSYDRMWVNDGKISNKGFGVTLDGDIVRNSNWFLSATLIYSRNRNKVVSLGNSATSGLLTDPNTGMQYEYSGNSLPQFRQYANILAIGHPMNVFYGYKVDGIIQTTQEGLKDGLTGLQAQPGEFKYVDLNGDGVINQKDQTIIGNPNPKFSMSLALNLSYKRFSASVFFNGEFGQDVLNTQAFNQPSNEPLRWTPDNPTNNYPSLRSGRQEKFSNWWIENGSFVRIQNVNLGYTVDLPQNMSVRFFVNASDLFTFTNFKGYDPEVGTNGIYYGGIPRIRKVTVGTNLTF